MTACQSYQARDQVCRDGFMQRPFCAGNGGCFQCGHVSEKALPYCLRDELPGHWVREDGSPIFWRPA